MAEVSKNLPFFLSINSYLFQVMGGALVKQGLRIESLALARTPLDLVAKGRISQPQSAAVLINRFLNQSRPKKIKTRFGYISLPDEEVFSKFFSFPKIESQELESAIYFKVKDFLPFLSTRRDLLF